MKYKRNCCICKKQFTTYKNNGKYCSRECYYISLKTRILSESWKKKIGNANKGKKHTKEFCDNIGKNNKKRKVTIYTKELMSKKHIGSLNSSWKGGVAVKNNGERKSLNYRKWRKLIFQRDSYMCKIPNCLYCKNKKGGNLIVHHLENYSENKQLRLEETNGITICKKSHITFHKLYGKLTNKTQFQEYIDKQKAKENEQG